MLQQNESVPKKVGCGVFAATFLLYCLMYGSVPVEELKGFELSFPINTVSRYTVCGTPWSFPFLKEGRSCYNKTKIEAGYDLTPCPWPESSIFDDFQKNGESTSNLSPIPGSERFRNFSVNEARHLLRDIEMVIVGDSTSRRLFWTLCNFLVGDASFPLVENGEGNSYKDVVCDQNGLMKSLGISLVFSGAPDLPDLSKYSNPDVINHYVEMAENHLEKKSLQKKLKFHLFVPFLTFHIVVPCNVFNWTDVEQSREQLKTCKVEAHLGPELTDLVMEDPSDESLSCAFVAKLHQTSQNIAKNWHTKADVTVHGFSNIAISPSIHAGVKYSEHADYFSYNPMLSAYAWELGQKRCSRFREFVQASPKFNFVDETSWTTKVSTNATPEFVPILDKNTDQIQRHECFVGERWQGIHIYNEQAQLMRAQTFLNAIWHSTRKG